MSSETPPWDANAESMEQLSQTFPPKRRRIIKASAWCSRIGPHRIQMERFIHTYEQDMGPECVRMAVVTRYTCDLKKDLKY